MILSGYVVVLTGLVACIIVTKGSLSEFVCVEQPSEKSWSAGSGCFLSYD